MIRVYDSTSWCIYAIYVKYDPRNFSKDEDFVE